MVIALPVVVILAQITGAQDTAMYAAYPYVLSIAILIF
tara:strand:- start:602 stop:715 length:114 start_codon:yes stop_codon:yes gene_type:complete